MQHPYSNNQSTRVWCITACVLLSVVMVMFLVTTGSEKPLTVPACGSTLDAPLATDTLVRLRMPVAGVDPQHLRDGFTDRRDSGRAHEALDILAAQGTPVRAASAGQIVKLVRSKRGGITLYQKDPTGRFVLYYAHLQRYADGVQEGQQVQPGAVLGYVGTTGNASPHAPHLHFAVWHVCDPRQFWHGTPINPYPLLRPTS